MLKNRTINGWIERIPLVNIVLRFGIKFALYFVKY